MWIGEKPHAILQECSNQDLHGELFDLSRFTFDIPGWHHFDRRSTSFSAKELEIEERAQNDEVGSAESAWLEFD